MDKIHKEIDALASIRPRVRNRVRAEEADGTEAVRPAESTEVVPTKVQRVQVYVCHNLRAELKVAAFDKKRSMSAMLQEALVHMDAEMDALRPTEYAGYLASICTPQRKDCDHTSLMLPEDLAKSLRRKSREGLVAFNAIIDAAFKLAAML